ncbi:hypothetical protein GW17_00007432 [Ensete ventricosum]|nr:hypothetical protein GW17_00007432 [Ensete ventricosum]
MCHPPLVYRSREAVGKRRPLKMKAGSYYIPHMRKLKGEDAHFICEREQVVGVADGVGGWAKLGIDAGVYARELMSHAEQAVRASPEGFVDPFQVLATAHARTNALGASTACIMALKDQVFYSSSCMQSNAALTIKSMGVEPGDIIVVATDGVFDNLFDSEVVPLIKSGLAFHQSAERIANLIADAAQRNSIRRLKETPFSRACRKAGKRRKGAYIVGVVDHSYLATRLPLWLTLSSYASTTPVVLAVRDASTGEGIGLTCVRLAIQFLGYRPYLCQVGRMTTSAPIPASDQLTVLGRPRWRASCPKER